MFLLGNCWGERVFLTRGAGGAGLGFGDPTSMTIGSIAAALTRAGQLRVRETVAREVAEILASTDPSQSAMQ